MEGITTEQDALYFKKRYKYFYVVCEGLWLACLRFLDASILTGWRLHMIILIGELFWMGDGNMANWDLLTYVTYQQERITSFSFSKRHRPPQSLLCFFQSVSHTHPDQAPEGIGFCRSNFRFWTIDNLALSSRKSKEYSESHGGWVQVLAYPSITFVPYYASVSLFGVWALLSKHYKIGMLTNTCQRSHRTEKVWDALGLSQHHCAACVLKSTLTPNSCLHTCSWGV